MKLTLLMRDALTLADKAGPVGLRRVHHAGPGAPPWPVHPATLHALVERTLLVRTETQNRDREVVERWTVTDLGREALQPREIVKQHRPLYLAAAGGQVRYRQRPNGRWTIDDDAVGIGDYTTDPSRSIDNDAKPGRRPVALEVLVGPSELDAFARDAEDRRQAKLRTIGARLDTLTVAQRVDLLTATAAKRKIDITTQLRLIRFMAARGREHHAAHQLASLEASLNHREAA